MLPGPSQRHYVVDIDIAGILDDVASERADPPAGGDTAPIVVGKPDCGRRTHDQGFRPTVLAIPVGVIPAMAEGRPGIFLLFFRAVVVTVKGCQRQPLGQSAVSLQAGLHGVVSSVVVGALVPTAFGWVADTA